MDSGVEYQGLVLNHLDSLYNYALVLTRRSQDAEDLLQDVLVRGFQGFGGYDRSLSFKGYSMSEEELGDLVLRPVTVRLDRPAHGEAPRDTCRPSCVAEFLCRRRRASEPRRRSGRPRARGRGQPGQGAEALPGDPRMRER